MAAAQALRIYTPPPRAMEEAIAEASATRLTWTPSHLFLYVHGGLDAAQDEAPRETPRPTSRATTSARRWSAAGSRRGRRRIDRRGFW